MGEEHEGPFLSVWRGGFFGLGQKEHELEFATVCCFVDDTGLAMELGEGVYLLIASRMVLDHWRKASSTCPQRVIPLRTLSRVPVCSSMIA